MDFSGFNRPLPGENPRRQMGAAQQPQKKKSSLMQSLLPTLGGTAGGIGGGALGGALAGSAILPGVGTAAGGLIGALLGGAAGGAAGRVAENAAKGDALGNGVANQALEQGIFAAGPLRLLKTAKAGVQAAKAGTGLAAALGDSGSIGQAVLGKAAKSATTATGEPLRTSVKGRLQEYGNKALESQYGTISKPVARATNPTKTIGALADAGITNPADVERVASAITGSNGLLNKAVIKATGNAANVNTSGIRRVFTDALDNTGVVGKERKSLQTFFDAQMIRATGGAAGEVGKGSNPSNILDVMKALERRSADLKGKGSNYRLSTPERMDQAKVIDLVRNELEDRLYKGAGANSNLKSALTPKLRQKLVDLMPGNQAWANHVDKNIMQAKDVGTLRSAQSPFVKARQIIDEGDINGITFGGRMGNGANGMLDKALSIGTELVKKPAARAAGQGLRKAGNVAPTMGAGASNPFSALNVAKRTVPIGLASAISGAASQSPNIDPSMSTAAQSTQTMTNPMGMNSSSSIDQQYPSTTDTQSGGSIFDPANVEGNIQKILTSGGTIKDVTDYVDLVATVSKLQPQSNAKLNSTTATQLASNANAVNTLQQLQDLFGMAGGGAGKIAGSLKNALGSAGVNSDTASYNALAASSVSQLARALNGGGQVSDADAAVVIQALPKITDSPAVAQTKFKALLARLQAAQQNSLMYGAGGDTSLASGL